MVREEPTSPFMLFVSGSARQAHRIPAVRHVDGTARVQTIPRSQHPPYYDLIQAFERRTGVPVLVNTSFNTRASRRVYAARCHRSLQQLSAGCVGDGAIPANQNVSAW